MIAALLGTFGPASPALAVGPPASAAGTYQIPAATDDVSLVKAVVSS